MHCVYNSKVWESLSSWTPDFEYCLCTEQRWLHCRPRCCVMTSVWTSHTVGFINPRATEGRAWLKIENSWNLVLAVSLVQTLPPNLRVSWDERAKHLVTNKWTEASSLYLLYPHDGVRPVSRCFRWRGGCYASISVTLKCSIGLCNYMTNISYSTVGDFIFR